MIERALIIRQPHIGRILDGSKTWEMRSTKTKIRGRIALIEGGSGLIVGECELINSAEPLTAMEISIMGGAYYRLHRITDNDLLTRWPCPWALRNAKRYDKPIPYKHPAGAVIWVNLPKAGVMIP